MGKGKIIKKNQKPIQGTAEVQVSKREESKPVKGTEEVNTQAQIKIQENTEVKTNVWKLIKEAEDEVRANLNSLDEMPKTAKQYEHNLKSLSACKKQIEKTEKVKTKETAELSKPKAPRPKPYSETKVGVVDIDGKKKDKYEIVKVENGPILVKYRAHVPEGLNEEQKKIITDGLAELMVKVKAVNEDFRLPEYKKYVNSVINGKN